MRKLLFLLLFVSFGIISKAQLFEDWQADNVMLRIPVHLTYSTTDIADYVKQNFDTGRKKLRAVYSWVARNIKYDTDSANNINMGPDPDAKITAALRRRRGVCENYAAIFNDICVKAGLTSFVIEGYTKQNGFIDKTGHSWCAVFIDNNWQLCDPTWDEGTGNTRWFAVDPPEMIASHMPFDPMWQLLDHPVSHKQFYSGNVYADKSRPFFNYKDSISAYIKMDSLQRFRATAYRIEQSGLYNTLVKNRHEFTKMNIEIIREDKDVDLYNSSVADLNTATTIYNNFVEYRNKQFTPSMTDNALEALLNGLDGRLYSAHKKLNEIDKTEAVFKFSTEEIRNRLNALA
ncbi:MAG TPA: transglutaminase domain-containing protein, partial [Chitinophagaceae bacterium]|nr:transglutaminase domain-containing protein [Chitinophagaceae bacterium]